MKSITIFITGQTPLMFKSTSELAKKMQDALENEKGLALSIDGNMVSVPFHAISYVVIAG